VTRMRRLRVAAWLLALSLAAVACGQDATETPSDGAAGEPEVSELTIMMSHIPQVLPVFVAEEIGFFEEYGLAVELPLVEGGAGRFTEGLLAGEADMAMTSWSVADNLAQGGQQLKYLTWHVYYARPEIEGEKIDGGQHDLVVLEDSPYQAMEDLEGATIALIARGSHEEAILRFLLSEAGVDPDSVTFVEAFWADHPQLLESGAVDAAYMIYPFLACCIPYPETEGGGIRSLGDPLLGGEQGMPMVLGDEGGAVTGPIATTADFVAENPNTIRAYAFAVRDAIDWISENKEEAFDIAVEATGLEEAALLNSPPTIHPKCLDQVGQMERLGEIMMAEGVLDSLPDYEQYTSDLPFSDEEMCTDPDPVVLDPSEFAD
jgi:NitT/TauT family transport system substrate-binding protein